MAKKRARPLKENKPVQKGELPIAFVVSDVSGDTCSKFTRAVLDQFPVEYRTKRFTHVQDPSRLPAIMKEAKAFNAWVLYTLANPRMCAVAAKAARAAGVIATDVMGLPLTDATRWLGMNPLGVPQHRLTREYQRIVEAVDYTDLCDDGKNLALLGDADIVFVGVSRSSKTVLARFLAQSGYKVANVPFTTDWQPVELDRVDRRRVFVLFMDPERIVQVRTVRSARDDRSRRSAVAYTSLDGVNAELESLREYTKRHPGWHSVSINGGIEEAAADILELLHFHFSSAA